MIHYMTTNGVGNAWVANELRVLARERIPFVLHSLIRPATTFFASEDVAAIDRGMRVIYPLDKLRSVSSFALAPFRFRQRFAEALWNALTGERENFRNRAVGVWHFFTACTWAGQMKDEKPSLIHSQWIHSGGTVAMYGSWLLGVPFSFTGHAADLFRERAALADKIRRAAFIICISEFHREFFLTNGARPEQLHIAYCGIDTTSFSPSPRKRQPGQRFQIRSSGRLVEKKGFDYLIRACRILRDRKVDFECVIAGSGPLQADLGRLIEELGLGDCVSMTGKPLKQEEIPAFMHGGDVYCLPCVWASDNDVDGLPQMLMEAMACGLPVISTRLVGIPDLVIHEQTGLLVEPNQVEPIADALQRAKDDPALSERLAEAGRKFVIERFDLTNCLEPLLNQFRKYLEVPS